jgi:hypothetical protein
MNLEESTKHCDVFFGRGANRGAFKVTHPTGWSQQYVQKIKQYARLCALKQYCQNVNKSLKVPKYNEHRYDDKIDKLELEGRIYAEIYARKHPNGYCNVEPIKQKTDKDEEQSISSQCEKVYEQDDDTNDEGE